VFGAFDSSLCSNGLLMGKYFRDQWYKRTNSSMCLDCATFSSHMMLVTNHFPSAPSSCQLGVIPKGLQSEATCSHAYVKGDSHQWTEADGVMIFNKAVLPGYSALFRHYNDDMYLGAYMAAFVPLFCLLHPRNSVFAAEY
jgi:hypothetical protein